MRLRQIALAVDELPRAEATLTRLLGLGRPFRDPGVGVFGLENAVFTVGDTFLELVAPVRPDTSAGRWLARFGDGGYMVILETRDLDADRARALRCGARIVFEAEVEGARTVHLHPRDVGGAILSFDAMPGPGVWQWAGPDWPERAGDGRVRAIGGVVLSGPDPDGLAARWAALVGSAARAEGDRRLRIDLDGGGVLRFARAPEHGKARISSLTLLAEDPDRVLRAARSLGLPVRDAAVQVLGVVLELAREPAS